MFDKAIIFPSMKNFKENIKKGSGIPCHECLVQASCYDEHKLKDGEVLVKISKRCDDFDRWYEECS